MPSACESRPGGFSFESFEYGTVREIKPEAIMKTLFSLTAFHVSVRVFALAVLLAATGCASWDYAKGVDAYSAEDYETAARRFLSAAERGHSEAQYCLALCYEKGTGVNKDLPEAVKWCRAAAEQGHGEAQLKLGTFYHDGRGVGKDWHEAAKWFRKAADQGFAEAQYRMGRCHHNGEGVPKQDFREAAKWYRKAAEQGHADAQYYLGVFCIYFREEGLGEIEAVEWFRKAAEQGHAKAAKALEEYGPTIDEGIGSRGEGNES